MLAPAGRADPYPLYAEAHRLGPVSRLADSLYLVAGYQAVDQLLRDPGFGLYTMATGQDAEGPLDLLNRSILRANPPDHPRMRSLIGKVFTPRRVAALAPRVERAVDELLDALAAGSGPVDFMDRFAFPLPVTVICALLGVEERDHTRLRPLAADLTEVLELTGPTTEAAAAAATELAGRFTGLVAARRAEPRDDLISALVAVRDAEDGRLSDAELLGNLILLLVAGFETTTSLLGSGLSLLLERPELLAALHAASTAGDGDAAVAGFVEEVLRYESPVQVLTRTALVDGRTVAGRPVPRGADLIVLVGAANRDPARYRDPDSFDPTRTDVRPLSFGAGAHICLGNNLARLEATVAFTRLVRRFPALAAAGPAVRRDRLVLRGLQSLPVRIGAAG
ncbi:cytochrome P450 [Actinocatenispora thailandica]|uniref:cytochrome P450 n=1 Tax=Actinocatenispora thailandica TaxID=227318 RepID=UPI00195046AF|nr:cytochrome P450 [Actinocatenispora thailandica]